MSEYIAGIENVKDIITLKRDKADIENILNRATQYHSCRGSAQNDYTIDNRQKGQFPYNYVKVWHGDIDQLALFLGMYFVHRSDCYAKQYLE